MEVSQYPNTPNWMFWYVQRVIDLVTGTERMAMSSRAKAMARMTLRAVAGRMRMPMVRKKKERAKMKTRRYVEVCDGEKEKEM